MVTEVLSDRLALGAAIGRSNKVINFLANLLPGILQPTKVELLETNFDILEFFFDRETLHQKYMLSSFQSNIIYPGGEEQQLHVDSSLSNPLPPWPIRLNINFLLNT